MEAPPYSPTATSSERRLPSDYWPVEREEEGEDPLRGLLRRQNDTAPRLPTSPQSQHPPQLSSPSSSQSGDYPLQPIATPSPTAIAFQSPFVSPLDLPPQYAAVDELARSFRLEAPFVFTTKTSSLPRYQLMQAFRRSGRPSKLSIRRLTSSESRSHSISSASASSSFPSFPPRIRYDEDATMYTTSRYELAGPHYCSYEMRGHRSSTLGGIIKVESGTSLLTGKWMKMWQLTRNARLDSLNPENEAKIQKYGYHSKKEWNKKLLFLVKNGVWVDGEGREVAREYQKGEFEVCEDTGRERWKRDLAVSCWVVRMWIVEGLRWEGDVKGW